MIQEEEFYIHEDYATLCGPYDHASRRDMRFLENVIKDMRRGNIDYRLIKDEVGRTLVQRKGMKFPKNRAYEDIE